MLLYNPYIIAGFAFLFSFVTYCLYWSGLYPNLSYSLLIFIVLFISFNFLLGWIFKAGFYIAILKAKEEIKFSKLSPKPLHILIIIAIYIVEVIYNRGIPLVQMLAGLNIDYRDFSFPGVHIFFTTFTSFFSIYSYLWYLKEKRKLFLVYNVICIGIFVSLMHRSSILFILSNMSVIYVICKGINIRKAILALVFVVSVMFVFGVAGDLRTRAQIGDDSEFNSTVLMEATSADSTIMQNKSLHPLYWSYLYISSPLANFQNTIDTFQNRTYSSFENKIFFLLYEMVPDILTNKIAPMFGYSEHYSPLSRIIDFLTVGTIFADSFALIGWVGPIILAALFLCTPLMVLRVTPKNHLFIIQISMCGIILALCTFSNMLVYSTFSLQLIYPLLLSFPFKRLITNSTC